MSLIKRFICLLFEVTARAQEAKTKMELGMGFEFTSRCRCLQQIRFLILDTAK
jgi:hypothetical protein